MDVSLARSYYRGEKLDGLEITRLLKDDEATRDLPVLLATAHAMKGDRERFLERSGADGYITKPVVNHRDLIDQIRTHIRESRARAEEPEAVRTPPVAEE